ncbi:MAG: response regulator, partial [Gemmatimonadales bacterium]
GRLLIETANVEITEPIADGALLIPAGRYIMLSVTDTGVGMDRETQARMFEPFFTTKPVGKGTGLGLTTVYGVVRQCGGFISVYSEPGTGTCFRIYLPRVDDSTAAPEDGAGAAPVGGSETVLIVEDEPAVRSIVHNVLGRLGYRVLDAADGEIGLALAARHQGPIHLLVSDVVMPGMSGRQLADRFTGLRPEAKVLFVSGYTDDAVVRHGILELGTHYLQKPFTPDMLARKVRRVLDTTPPRQSSS